MYENLCVPDLSGSGFNVSDGDPMTEQVHHVLCEHGAAMRVRCRVRLPLRPPHVLGEVPGGGVDTGEVHTGGHDRSVQVVQVSDVCRVLWNLLFEIQVYQNQNSTYL